MNALFVIHTPKDPHPAVFKVVADHTDAANARRAAEQYRLDLAVTQNATQLEQLMLDPASWTGLHSLVMAQK